MEIIKMILCLYVAGWGAVTDVRMHKIKNVAVLVGIAGGLLLHVGNIVSVLAGMVFPLLLFPLFLIRIVGAGDIKLLCAVGAILGYPMIVEIILYSFVFCGIHILLRAIIRCELFIMIKQVWYDMIHLVTFHRVQEETCRSRKIPMAVSILAASVLLQVQNLLNS